MSPYNPQGTESLVPCGYCLSCRINKRREWTARIVLESSRHELASFVTLTYSPENYPVNGSLDKTVFQLFMKRLRKSVEPVKLRYFGCGEYGDKTQRAHYHVVLFGMGRESESLIARCWSLGFVYVGDLTVRSAQYVAGYVTKKMTSKEDSRLKGREPEFALMSKGLGRDAIPDMAASLGAGGAGPLMRFRGDAPSVIRAEQKFLPIGRYLLTRLRKEVGFEDGKSAEWVREARQKELHTMFALYSTAKAVGNASRAAAKSVNIDAVAKRMSIKSKGDL